MVNGSMAGHGSGQGASPNRDPLGACGLFCGACPRYRVTMPGGDHLLAASGESYEAFHCLGCHSDKLSEFCQQCALRLCAKDKGIRHCGLCKEFPCPDLEAFAAEGHTYPGARHRRDVVMHLLRVREIGAEAWIAEQQARWTCACGAAYSGYETACRACGRTLASFVNEQR